MNAVHPEIGGAHQSDRIIVINAQGTRILPSRGARGSPTPDFTLELTGEFRYREVRIYNPSALLLPLGTDRIGRHIKDVLPPALYEPLMQSAVDAAVARDTVTFQQMSARGIYRVSVIVPHTDCIIGSVTLLK